MCLHEDIFKDEVVNYHESTFPEPREFQTKAHDKLRQGVIDGHRCQMLMAPTGAGKTFLGLRVAHEALRKGFSATFVCDRTTLINQTSEVADSYGLSAHGIIQADHWRVDHRMRMQIASVQTLARRQWPTSDVIIVDEAHTMYKGWTKHVQNTDAKVIGLSATPFSVGLGKIFTNLVNAATMAELTESGVLVPLKVLSCTRINMKDAEVVAGEWSDKAAEQRGMEIIGDIVKEWLEYAGNKKTIVFGATINHCEEMARSFNAVGVKAAVFTSHTSIEERAEILKEYRKLDSEIRVLISVEALAKGFDVKDVECVCDARPLRKSLSTFMQMIGRGLRSSTETGKTECLLLDFSGNIIRFREDYEDIFNNGLDTLDAGNKLDKTVRKDNDEDKEPAECPQCKAIPFFKKCMLCGFEVIKPSLIEHLDGQMQEIQIGKSKTPTLINKQQLFNELCTHVKSHTEPEKQEWRAKFLYKDFTGEFPDRSLSFKDSVNVPISRAVANKIQSLRIAYAHRRH